MDTRDEIISMYRVQFNGKFTFKDLKPFVSYLKKMGVDSIYASPILKSTSGSTHGYDVIDPTIVNEELGGEKELIDLSRKLHRERIKWVQDLVPNHMALSTENVFLRDILAKGRKSPYWKLFDFLSIPEFNNKIDLFILGLPYEDAIKSGVIKIVNTENPAIKMYNQYLPMSEISIAHLRAMLGENASDEGLRRINSDQDMLHALLSEQHYSLRYWKSGTRGTDYRRFFSVNSLIAIRPEGQKCFNLITGKIVSLYKEGILDAFRLDHVDGLYDPGEFLLRFAKKTGKAPVWVEKILAENEMLPDSWITSGTTGYDFLFHCTYIFVDRQNERTLNTFYRNFTGERRTPMKIGYENKRIFLSHSFTVEVLYISYIFHRVLNKKIYGHDVTLEDMKVFAAELMASFNVYRTYISPLKKDQAELKLIENAIRSAGSKTGLWYIQKALLRMLGSINDDNQSLFCFQRLQQFIPATIAKSIEDRVFFQYNLLISLNEVGCAPQEFSLSPRAFHRFMIHRSTNMPHTMNTLSTHDTKLGEDIRARITSLSHMAELWTDSVKEWHRINMKYKTSYEKNMYPTENHEYYTYQILLAEDPDEWTRDKNFRERIKGQMIKAAREDGTMTRWNSPNREYEDDLENFLERIMKDKEFRGSFNKIFKRAQLNGVIISLSQNLIKLTAPGIPDIYQGSEMLNLSFTDPDNRRPVDFARCEDFLDRIISMYKEGDIQGIAADWKAGSMKLFMNYIMLNFRKANPELFLSGDYREIQASGIYGPRILGYSRELHGRRILIVVPITIEGISDDLPMGIDSWKDTSLILPEKLSGQYTDIFTGKKVIMRNSINIGEIFSDFPFSVLDSEAI